MDMFNNVHVGIKNLGLKGHNTQHSGHTDQTFFQTETTPEIQLVRPTGVCGKV